MVREERLRTFIAFEFPQAVHQRCEQIQSELRQLVKGVSWVKRGNVHVTLKFLGDIAPDQKRTIIDTLEEPLRDEGVSELQLNGIGVFPNWRSPRVIWVGVSTGGEALGRLAALIEERLQNVGFPAEKRRFRPHVTLGRIRRPTDLTPLRERVGEYDELGLDPILVDQVVLMRSELHPKGSIYTPLHRFHLKGRTDTNSS